MYARLNNRLTPLLNYLYFFFALWPLHFGLTVFPFMVYGYQIYIAYIFSDPTSNETFLMILNYIVLYSVMRLIYFSNSKWCGNRLVYWLYSLSIIFSTNFNCLMWRKDGSLYTQPQELSVYIFIFSFMIAYISKRTVSILIINK